MVRELNTAAERDPVGARQALLQALEGPITLHPENGVLVAEIVYSAPVPMVGGVAENMVAGARYANFRMRRQLVRAA